MSDSEGPATTRDGAAEDPSTTVLELFGVRLKVKNPRLAEVLTMDAADALSTDVRQLLDPEQVRALRAEAGQAAPELVLTPQNGRDDVDARIRADMRARADAIGEALGFDAAPGGEWASPTGITVVTRVVERPLSYAAAIDFVDTIARVLEGRDAQDTTALFVVDSQRTADVFNVAIRQRRLYDHIRTISAENLEAIRSLFGSGALDHSRALVLLTPIANADVGEVLNIIRAAGSDASECRPLD